MKYFVYGVIAFVAVAVVAGIALVGSPKSERARQFDERRISDLQNIQSQVVSYWQRKQVLPPSQGVLRDDISGFVAPMDPESGAVYEYATSGPQSFELCAIFNQPNVDGSVPEVAAPTALRKPGFSNLDWNWTHGAGRTCFERTIDPALYPPVSAPRASGGCVITGCSGQICSDTEAVTTCEFLPAYACYRQYSTCGRQASGQCGWAPTPGLSQCLSGARTAPGDIPQ